MYLFLFFFSSFGKFKDYVLPWKLNGFRDQFIFVAMQCHTQYKYTLIEFSNKYHNFGFTWKGIKRKIIKRMDESKIEMKSKAKQKMKLFKSSDFQF